MPFTSETIAITAEEHDELEQMTRSRTLPAADIFRARLILMLAEDCRIDLKGRIAGLTEVRHAGKGPFVITPALTAKVIGETRRQPKDRSTHLSCRRLAQSLGVSKDSVQRICQRAELKPHRSSVP